VCSGCKVLPHDTLWCGGPWHDVHAVLEWGERPSEPIMQPNFTLGSPSVPLPAAPPALTWISGAESPLNAAHSVPQVSLQQKLLSGDAARGYE